jgi:hypothetical protein
MTCADNPQAPYDRQAYSKTDPGDAAGDGGVLFFASVRRMASEGGDGGEFRISVLARSGRGSPQYC